MTDYIAYWKYFWRDIELFGPAKIIHEWHTTSESVFNNLVPGNNIWVIIQAGKDYPVEWRLLQRIYIVSLGIDTRKDNYEVDEYGHFCAFGDKKLSQIFEIKDQQGLTPVLHKLEFVSGRRLTARGKLIGRSFQMLRPITANDSRLLDKYSKELKLITV